MLVAFVLLQFTGHGYLQTRHKHDVKDLLTPNIAESPPQQHDELSRINTPKSAFIS